MLTDIPYLEPLLFWLRNDESLKQHFTEKSFFMPKKDLESAAEAAIKSDCPAPRALWIIPSNTNAFSRKVGCKSQGLHTFQILIFVQCIRDSFQLVKKNDGSVKLEGQFMELAQLRKLVKDSVHNFYIQHEQKTSGKKLFGDLMWTGDQYLFPDDDNFLSTAIEFEIKIYP